ncbi:hypothetical protein EDB19DRAFT_1257678 [Suillus lakei]|nr:hypothetical protein EDB19DRAFT_1257678 [Suillus lakei]
MGLPSLFQLSRISLGCVEGSVPPYVPPLPHRLANDLKLQQTLYSTSAPSFLPLAQKQYSGIAHSGPYALDPRALIHVPCPTPFALIMVDPTLMWAGNPTVITCTTRSTCDW